MKHTQLTLSLTKTEQILGWIYLALWLTVLPFAIALLCVLAGCRSDAVVNLIYYGVNFVCCGLIFRRMLRQSFENIRGDRKRLVNATVQGIGFYFLSAYVASVLILMLKPDFANANDALVGAMLDESPMLMALAVIFLVPVAEECLFRGLLFVSLAKKNRILAYVVTALVFSAVHIVGHLDSYDAVSLVICLMQYAPGAAVLCWACESADSLFPPIIIHALINAFGVLSMR